MKGYMYILQCRNWYYYVGSTSDLKKRLKEHQDGIGANFTRKYSPVKLVYYEEYERIEDAFEREKQVQRWSRKKKEALIYGFHSDLNLYASCKNLTHFRYYNQLDDKLC